MKKKLNKFVLVISFLLISLTALVLLQVTKMEKLEDIVEAQVNLDSEILYNLTITYDGVDRNGDISSEVLNNDGKTKIIKVDSGYIYVEDILPEGLEFYRFNFVGSDNSLIGSAKRDNSVTGTCNGYVVNDSIGSTDPKSNHGLHYDPITRKVTFKIKNLTAGCKLSVGIITKTPMTIIGNRKDFYNTATAWEGNQMSKSNMVHAFIQTKNITPNKVSYRLIENPTTGTEVPVSAKVPDEQEYESGATVNLAWEPKIEGYTFSGWEAIEPLNLTISGDKFTMPNNNVVFQGYFTENSKYEVSYRIDGEGPDNYVLPLSKKYYENAIIKVDSMSTGDVFNGYRFLGWTIEGIEISEDNDFIMPAKNIEIVGRWEQIKYKVTYDFHTGVRPPNYQTILNELNSKDNTYAPGEKVKLPLVDDIPATDFSNGYHFQGWYKEDNFVMPEEDVIVYGEWKIVRKTFTPSISKEIIDKKEYYKKEEIVSYNITVTNNENYEIRNVIVKEYNEDSQFIEDETNMYVIRSPHVVEIPSIPAKGSVIVKATYEVTENDTGTIINTVEILGATADNNDLDTSDEAKEKYKATASFDIYPEIKISKIVSNEDSSDKVFQFHITSEKGYDTWVNLTNKEEEILYLEPTDTYSIKEVIPQEYTLENVSGAIESNGGSVELNLGDKLNVEFTNKHHRKGYYHSDGRVSNEIKKAIDDIDKNGDGIPDKYQVIVDYRAVNGTVSFQAVWLTLYDENGKPSEKGTAILTSEKIPTTTPNAGYNNGTWDVNPFGATITSNTTFTITYVAPTPDIPDISTPDVPDPSATSLSVNMLWINDTEMERPASISVQLYKDGAAYGNPVTLSASNGWSYKWGDLNASNSWTIGEVAAPEGYTSSINKSGSIITITNIYEDNEIENPDVPL